jgi:uncharacterized membrane protein
MKSLGREVLKGRWGLSFCAMLVYSAALYIPYEILMLLFGEATWISLIYSILVGGPLTLGYSIFALALFRNEEPGISQIFYGFERFGQSLGLYLLICIFVLLWFLIPVAGVVLSIIAVLRYSQAFYIMADNPGLGINECITRSKMMMMGNKTKYFILGLSFIGWVILAAIPPVLAASSGFTTQAVSVFSIESALAYYEPSLGLTAMVSLASLGFVLLQVYLMAVFTAFYEMAAGNLRPGYITSTAEVIDENFKE